MLEISFHLLFSQKKIIRERPKGNIQFTVLRSDAILRKTFSKSVAPAIRISYLVLPEPLLATCEPELQRFSSTVSRIDQMILNSFLKEGHYERHLNRMRAIYGHKQEILVGELKQLSGVCTIRGEDAGVHLLLEFSDDWTEAELIRRAEAVHIRVYPLSEYSIDGADSGAGQGATILLGYATMTEEELAQAARSLTEVWR